MMQETHTISMDGSEKYSWENVDEDAKKHEMNRSQFFQYLYKRYKEKRKVIDYTILIMLLGFAIIILLLLLQWRG